MKTIKNMEIYFVYNKNFRINADEFKNKFKKSSKVKHRDFFFFLIGTQKLLKQPNRKVSEWSRKK